MRKVMVVMALGLLALSVLAALGCGGNKTTITTPEGKVTVEEGKGTTTIKTGEGETTWSDKPPSEQQLGLPIYPGAEYVPGSGGSSTFSGEEGAASVASAEFTTGDSFDKVLSWYQGKLGEPFFVTEGKEATFMVSENEENVKTVNITAEDGKVKIYLGTFGSTKR